MQNAQLTTLTGMIVALQFAAFGWRVNREIGVGDAGRRTWFPLPDIANVVALLSVIGLCIVLPLRENTYPAVSRSMLAVAATLIACHPLTMAAHYGLFRERRHRGKDGDFSYAPPEEVAAFGVSLILAVGAGFVVWQ